MRRATVFLNGKRDNAAHLTLCPGKNFRTGIKDFGTVYSNLTTLEQDALLVASAVYACDLAFKRGEREDITRHIALRIPVVNSQAFENVHERLEAILFLLSHDNWTIEFTRANGVPESAFEWPIADGKTLLFSGGLDSLAAAVDLLDDLGPERLQLASHVTANRVTKGSQRALIEYLNKCYSATTHRVVVRSGGYNHKDYAFPSDHEREETQRTRSFMFLTIAALSARRSGKTEIVVIAENGQMAIHLPLSAARIGAFSTHTAHPQFVSMTSDYFTALLEQRISITNPYLYKTKAEVVTTLVRAHRTAIPKSVSCWRGSRLSSSNHCGECVPCLVRRIALEANGLKLKEFARDLFAESIGALGPNDEGKRNLVELAEFALAFRTYSAADLEVLYPDLINESIDRPKAVAMYKRFAEEALAVLGTYSGVRPLLPKPTPGTPAQKPTTASRPPSKRRKL